MGNFSQDPAAWMYVISLSIALYGTVLFAWWWGKSGAASSVFIYVTFVFLGEVIESALSLYARFLYFTCNLTEYAAYLSSWAWPLRKLFTILALSAIVIHMTYRACRAKSSPGRRETD
jgi:hypothetical protein